MQQTGTIGIVGGGQLGRMLTEAALPLGFKVIVIDPNDNCSAAQAGAEQIKAGFYDAAAIQQLADRADFITVESEHINTDMLADLTNRGKPVNPAPQTVALIQDKLLQKRFLRDTGLPVADFVEIVGLDSALTVLETFGGQMIIKTRRDAFDGRGNFVVKNRQDLDQAFTAFKGKPLYAEQFVPFEKELAVMVARDSQGNVATYPIVETIQQRNICLEVLAPAAISQTAQQAAEQLALEVAGHLEGAGVFGIELFLTPDGQIVINEIAPRVHNSGHYAIEACQTSQFENHIRAIAGLPLGPTDMKVPTAVMVNILGERDGPVELKGLEEAKQIPGVTVHLYGKSPTKIDRKMGHITATGDTLEEARQKAEAARKAISI